MVGCIDKTGELNDLPKREIRSRHFSPFQNELDISVLGLCQHFAEISGYFTLDPALSNTDI